MTQLLFIIDVTFFLQILAQNSENRAPYNDTTKTEIPLYCPKVS